jgi:NADH-quinone oxidoreductase subunit N
MVIDILALLKQELSVSIIIIVLLIIKIGAGEWKISNLLNFINLLLLINFLAGFVLNSEGSLFNGMFNTNKLLFWRKIF